MVPPSDYLEQSRSHFSNSAHAYYEIADLIRARSFGDAAMNSERDQVTAWPAHRQERQPTRNSCSASPNSTLRANGSWNYYQTVLFELKYFFLKVM